MVVSLRGATQQRIVVAQKGARAVEGLFFTVSFFGDRRVLGGDTKYGLPLSFSLLGLLVLRHQVQIRRGGGISTGIWWLVDVGFREAGVGEWRVSDCFSRIGVVLW